MSYHVKEGHPFTMDVLFHPNRVFLLRGLKEKTKSLHSLKVQERNTDKNNYILNQCPEEACVVSCPSRHGQPRVAA